MKRIGIAVVEWQNSFLVGVRSANAVLAGAAEFPGGKCLPDETPEQCAVRECLEETGIAVESHGLLMQTTHSYAHGVLELDFVRCIPLQPLNQPANGFHWIPRSELASLNFPEGNRDVVRLLSAQ